MTLLLIIFLALRNKPTLVEMKVTAQRVSFVALPPVEAEEEKGDLATATPSAARKISLFPRALAVEAMEVRDVDCVETTLDGIGPVALWTEPGGSIGIKKARVEEGLDTAATLRPELVLNEPTSLAFEITGRDKLTIDLGQSQPAQSPPRSGQPTAAGSGDAFSCAPSESEDRGWNGFLPTGSGMLVRLRDVRRSGPVEARLAAFPMAEISQVSRNAARFRVTGGRRDSRLSLALPHPAGPSAVLRVLDPATGEVSPPTSLPLTLSESRLIPWQDRLVLLDPEPGGARPVPLLRSDLKVRDLELTRRVQLEARSFVIDGEVRFPAGEKEPIKIEPGSFVSTATDPGRPLTLRSLELSAQSLQMLVWGESTSLRIGPTLELRVERLPSYFEWLVTHRLVSFVVGILIYVPGLCWTTFKLVGWVKG